MSIKDFQILAKLGQGAYSTVYKVVRNQDNKTYALKRVKIMNLNAKQKQNALNQIRILASIRHPNIISYKEAFFDQSSKSLCIVMEFASQGDLSHKIIQHQKKGTHFTEGQIWKMLIQIVKGLSQLHRLNIFHRDIKPANVFIHQGGLIKLGDMNVSKITERGFCMTQTGTPYYASPQVWKDQPYDEKSDIWSLGCVLYEMITLQPPFKAQDMEGLFKKVTRGIYQRLPSQYSQQLNTVIRLLLQINSQLRPSCQKILAMPQIHKKIKFNPFDEYQKTQLLKTIKADNIYTIGDVLPKSNYLPLKIKKAKGIKNLLESLEQKQMHQVQSLPALDKEKKIAPGQNSDRIVCKDNKASLILRERKKSEIASSSRSGLQINGQNLKQEDSKQLKLPRVANRYNKAKDINKHNSLKAHKQLQI